ncbi:hypothetical protein [Aneurinibacillus migulanus]|uniref:hypothetical protein n=1 Tax=Aneurinibacillus migulanus TaxID=47500 RepID=UPI0020A19878|nr:hypothetical protein [Aneurinibacillus migulanus]MCP1359067.1 hypothetical protein [Aneurinibacillus migulanus]
MSNKQEKLEVKKKLMFSKEEDYYFITYNVLIFLSTIGCTEEKQKFIDYTKLSYIIPFISNNNLINLLLKYEQLKRKPSKEEIEILQEVYLKSRLKLKLLTSILFALEHNEVIGLSKNEKRNCIDIWLKKDNISEVLLNSSLFKIEVESSLKIKKKFPYLKKLTVKKLLEDLFSSKGVRVWEI